MPAPPARTRRLAALLATLGLGLVMVVAGFSSAAAVPPPASTGIGADGDEPQVREATLSRQLQATATERPAQPAPPTALAGGPIPDSRVAAPTGVFVGVRTTAVSRPREATPGSVCGRAPPRYASSPPR